MAKVTLNKFNAKDEQLSRFQDSVDKAVQQLQIQPFLNGNILKVTLAVGDNVIQHQLGRAIQGYVVLSQSAATALYDNLLSTSDLRLKFTLNSSVACQVRLFVT